VKVIANGHSDIGGREENQDAILCDHENSLYIVCDGVGGVKGGRLAAEKAVESVRNGIVAGMKELEGLERQSQFNKFPLLIRDAVRKACEDVYTLAQNTPDAPNMGSTMTMLLVHNKRAYVGHVGDSRLYLCRGDSLHQLTDDHTFVRELVIRGQLTAEEAEKSPYAHVLTRWMGQGETVQVDMLQFDVLPGDTFLICSDGLAAIYENESVLTEYLTGEALDESLSEELVTRAVQEDGSDNTSCIVLRALSDEKADVTEEERVREVTLSIETLQGLYIFDGLTLQELIRVMERVVVYKESPNTAVIQEGQMSDSLMVILEGELSIEKGEKSIRQLKAGNHVGEMALLTRRPRSATVRTITDATLICLERSAFLDLLRNDSQLGVKLMMNLSRELIDRLITTNELLLTDVSYQSGQ
jgi:serine/threonine protein phosphatase PrpC